MEAELSSPIYTASVPWWRRTKWESTIAFLVFVAPMLIGLAVFTFWPIIWGLLISFSEARNTLSIGNWIGWDNYRAVLSDPQFRRSLRTIIVFAIFIVPLTFFLALFIALLVNSVKFGQGIFRSIFFIPTAISYVIASVIWKMGIFSGVPSGFANMLIYWFGSDQVIAWIGETNPPYYWLVLVTVRVWLQVGFYMIIFLAGLQEIDKSLYEAAYVDGGKPGWTTFWTITFPLLRNTSIAVLLLNFIAAFQAFDEFINILSAAGSSANLSLARPPLVYLYQVAISQQDYGRGSAGAFILTAIIIIVTLVQGRLFGFGRRA
ncbi:MAG TPA: sugar ABC transporter permease [Thermomicrobiales bacterium]|nr:sugar ABC transporter permease [Thermomicrobiales bacterium]